MLNNETAWKRLRSLVGGGVDAYLSFGSRWENAVRASRYKQGLARGEDPLRAAFESKSIVDFSAQGAWPAIRFLVQVVPFLNARIQGLSKLSQAVPKGRGDLASGTQGRRFMAQLALVGMASAVLYLAYKDDEDFKRREEWDRDSYWWFKLPGTDVAFRYPKPFEIGAMGTMFERMVEQIADDDVHGELFAERMMHMFTETFSFNPVPQVFKPWLDIYSNKDPFTKRPIESLGMQRLSPEERRRVWTTQTSIGISTALSKIGWDKVELSPVQVEHLIGATFGWGATAVIRGVDMVLRPALDMPDRPEPQLQEYGIVGRFLRENPERFSKYTTMMFEQVQEMREAYADVRHYQSLGDQESAMEKARENKDLLVWRRGFERVVKQHSLLRKRLDAVMRDPSMGPVEKRIKANRINQIMQRTSRMIVEAKRRADDNRPADRDFSALWSGIGLAD